MLLLLSSLTRGRKTTYEERIEIIGFGRIKLHKNNTSEKLVLLGFFYLISLST
jgi:hypothetical protein